MSVKFFVPIKYAYKISLFKDWEINKRFEQIYQNF